MNDGSSPAHDFRRLVSISDRSGGEFAGAKIFSPGSLLIVMGPLVAVGLMSVVYVVLGSFAPLPSWGRFAILPVGVLVGTLLVARYQPLRKPDHSLGSAFATGTDTRYRLRLVVPKQREIKGRQAWFARSISDEPDPDETELESRACGFEPIIVRAWFGAKRGGAYALTMLACTLLVFGAITVAIMLTVPSLSAWASSGLSMGLSGILFAGVAAALVLTELALPTYFRLSPGRLDIFAYPFMGRSKPRVRTYDLRRVGLCVHLGVWAAALEPERPFEGEHEPEMVRSKAWPYNKTRAPDRRPEHISLGLIPRRREFVCKLFQAARTDEPTPPLPERELTG